MVGAVASVALLGGRGFAAPPPIPFPTSARGYAAWMARAFDECNPATVSVVGANLPAAGCVAASTDNSMTMTFARLIVSARTGSVLVYGRGMPSGARVRVNLTLRTTRHNLLTKHPSGVNSVTFQDTVASCPNPSTSPFGYTVRPNGALLGVSKLNSCLGPNSGLAMGNVEIIDAALVNIDSGKTFAHPGLVR